MPNIRETLAQQVREIEIPNDGYLVCSGEEGFRRGHYAGRAAAASLIASSPDAKLAAAVADPASLLPDMVWEESVHGCRCDTPYGPYTIRKFDQFYWSFGFDTHGYAPSLEAAKAACDQDRRERVRKLFEVE